MNQDTERIRVGEEAENGEPVEMPVIDLLAGRGFITGKSGSGKSNTASVVAEQLLEAGYGLLIVDVDGEYYGLKEEYELLHAGADEECDIRVSPEHAEKLATLALEENVPIILDVSSYLDPDDADEMLLAVARQLFAKAKKQKKPFLVLVEECHEYIPEGGGMTETGKMLIKIGKRGRKHGLGIVGMSQRPADVKKDFITQCDWMVWHRLTWDNDTKVVSRIVGDEYGEAVPGLNAGEAFVQTDWTDGSIRRVQFNRKQTFDAGATPGLDDFERPELKSVSDALMEDLEGITELQEQKHDRVAELESQLERKQEQIAELENELQTARDVSAAARKMANALAHGDVGGPEDFEERLHEKNERIGELESRIAELEDGQTDLQSFEEREERQESEVEQSEMEHTTDDVESPEASDESAETPNSNAGIADDEYDDPVEAYRERLRQRGQALGKAVSHKSISETASLVELANADPVVVRIDAARRESLCNDDHTWDVIATLAKDGPMTVHEIADAVTASVEQIQSLLAELRNRSLATRDDQRRYALDRAGMVAVITDPDERAHSSELHAQWRD